MREIVKYFFVFDKSISKEEFDKVCETLSMLSPVIWGTAVVFFSKDSSVVELDYYSLPDGTISTSFGGGQLSLAVDDSSRKIALPKVFLNSYRTRRLIRNIPGFSVSQKKRVREVFFDGPDLEGSPGVWVFIYDVRPMTHKTSVEK